MVGSSLTLTSNIWLLKSIKVVIAMTTADLIALALPALYIIVCLIATFKRG